MYCSFAHRHLQQQYCHCWKHIGKISPEVGVDTCCHFLLTFFYWSKMTFQPNLESQEESEVAESEIWIWLWMGKGQNVILRQEQLQCQGGVTRNIMVKDPFLHFPAFFTKQHPSNASTLQYKKLGLCRDKLTLHHIQVYIVPQSWWSATITLLFQ
jgi:hypothetical protein